MILKRGGGIKYGIPYQGSKAKIMPTLSRMFPSADNFYDLFGGGFSVTHFMMENRSKSYKKFYYNEIRPGLPDLIRDAINGKYNFDNFKPEWVSREKFFAEKEKNPYIKIIWSFGNNGDDYLFGKEIENENEKRSMHMAVVFDEFDDWFKDAFKIDKWPNSLSITGKRLLLRKMCAKRIDLQQLQQLERLEQLQRLERLQQLQQLELTNLDYKHVKIEPNSVIYCDIPYRDTTGYKNLFSHKEFFDWAASQKNPVFVSEYNIEDDSFFLLKEMVHRSTFSAGGLKSIPVTEKLYGNKLAYEIIQSAKEKRNGKNKSRL
jgi:site-specific DNA-adenine methylase